MKRKVSIFGVLFLSLLLVFTLAACADSPNENDEDNENNENDVVDESPALADASYVGSESCKGCHSGQYEGWKGTWHAVAIQSPDELYDDAFDEDFPDGPWNELSEGLGNPIMIDADEPSGIAGTKDFVLLDGTEVKDVDGVYVYHLGDRKFEARYTAADGEVLHAVDVEVFGHGNKRRATNFANVLDGGGNYLLKYQIRYDTSSGEWPQVIGGERSGGVWNDRNDIRRWDANCGGCHAGGLDVEANLADRSLTAADLLPDLGVGCESCHGPASLHVSDPTNENLIVKYSELTTKQQNDACMQCHTRTTAHKDFDPEVRWGDAYGFVPGDDLDDYVEYILPTWGEDWRRVAADGKGRGWHQWGFDLQLGPKADWSCTDCHSVHGSNDDGQQFREYGSSPEVVVSMEAACASCHAGVYDTKETIREAMDGRRGWDDKPEFAGRTMQHTFRLDDEGRVIGLTEDEWPSENKWPWQ